MSDSKFFEGMLSDKFVMREGGRQMDKAAVVKLIAGNKCKVKDWKLEDPLIARIDADTYVLNYRGMLTEAVLARTTLRSAPALR